MKQETLFALCNVFARVCGGLFKYAFWVFVYFGWIVLFMLKRTKNARGISISPLQTPLNDQGGSLPPLEPPHVCGFLWTGFKVQNVND